MSNGMTITPSQSLLDPFRRVNYTLGLVLGVDEFNQEQLYLTEKNRLHNRTLHGYGTVCGLDVTVRDTETGPEILVSAGLAVNPRGQEIRVPLAQCAQLNDWLGRNRELVLAGRPASPPEFPPGDLTLYVVLCYRECKTDMVPVPGEPCRSQEDTMAASRIADDFSLALTLEPPDQQEELVVRRFGELLNRIQVSAGAGAYPDRSELEDLVRNLAAEVGSPPDGSPPDLPAVLFLHPDDAVEMLRAMARVWVTEVRPTLINDQQDCALAPPDGDCVLLARLDFGVTADWEVDLSPSAAVLIEQDNRPVLLHSRLLQEWLYASYRPGDGSSAAAVTDHGSLLGLGDDDHLQYLNIARGDARYALIAHSHALNDLSDVDVAAAGNGQVLTLQGGQWTAAAPAGGGPGGPAGGDLAGVYPNPRVAGLIGRPIANAMPGPGNVLIWNGAQWQPRPVAPLLPFVTITRLRAGIFEIWFNIEVPENDAAVQQVAGGALEVLAETNSAPFLAPIAAGIQPAPPRNVFQAQLEREAAYMRFRFNLERIAMADGSTMIEFMRNNLLVFSGYDGDVTVTAFVRGSGQNDQ